MKNLLTILTILIVAAATGCGEESLDFLEMKSMNDIGDEVELTKLALDSGDTDAYDDLTIIYLDYEPNSGLLPISLEMANKYNYPRAYLDVYFGVKDTGWVSWDEPLENELDSTSIIFAIDYLFQGAKLGSEQCNEYVISQYLEGFIHHEHIKNSNFLIQKHGEYLDSLNTIDVNAFLKATNGNPQKIIEALNEKETRWDIEYYRLSQDSCYLMVIPKEIERDFQLPLTQSWIDLVTRSLTTVPSVKHLDIEMHVIKKEEDGSVG